MQFCTDFKFSLNNIRFIIIIMLNFTIIILGDVVNEYRVINKSEYVSQNHIFML